MAITLENFIDTNNRNKISYNKLSLFDKSSDGSKNMISYNILNDYLEELEAIALDVALTDEQYLKYKYKPKLLAYDIYGSQELYFVILYINNIASPKEFDMKKIKMIKTDVLTQALSDIYNSEKELLENNRSEMNMEE